MTDYEKMTNALRGIVSEVAMAVTYAESWGDAYRLEKIDETVRNSPKRYRTPVNLTITGDMISGLSNGQKYALLMSQLTEGNWGIPLWMAAFIKDDAKVITINGKMKRFADMDRDVRAGILACWFA
jgi:hypothetical protein